MRLSPPPLRGYWFLGVTDCIGKPGSSSHGLCEVREASCLSVTDGRMRALPTSLAWRAVKPALGSSCPSECRGSVVVISLQVPVLAWIRRRCLDQNPKRLKNLLRRSNSLHRTRTSPSCGLLCSSNSGSELHTDFSKTVVSRHAKQQLTVRCISAVKQSRKRDIIVINRLTYSGASADRKLDCDMTENIVMLWIMREWCKSPKH